MSIKIENFETCGWGAAIRGMRNPLNSWDKADSDYSSNIVRNDTNIAAYGTKLNRYDFIVGQNDLALCTKLIKAGAEHRKFLRMIHVQMDITAPLYWWKEFETYKVGTTSNSCSTMHKIAAKPFDINDFSCEHLFDFMPDTITDSMETFDTVISWLNFMREKYLANPADKNLWWQMIQLLPSSYNQRRTVDMSMETVLNILHQRSHHKLDEWVELCDTMLQQIPYCQEFYAAMRGEPNGN